MSTWSERAHRSAEAMDMEAIEATDPEDVQYGFREGARWQREALLSDESVERAAREMFWQANEWEDGQDVWEAPEQVAEEIEEWVPLARAALAAAIGDK